MEEAGSDQPDLTDQEFVLTHNLMTKSGKDLQLSFHPIVGSTGVALQQFVRVAHAFLLCVRQKMGIPRRAG